MRCHLSVVLLFAAAPSFARAQIRPELELATGPAVYTEQTLDGGLRRALEVRGTVALRLGLVAFGLEAGTNRTNRTPGLSTCTGMPCGPTAYSDYYRSRTTHLSLVVRVGGRRPHQPFLTTGAGWYHVANQYETPGTRSEPESSGPGGHAGFGIGVLPLTPGLTLNLEARAHAALLVGSDDIGFTSFVTVTAGLQLR